MHDGQRNRLLADLVAAAERMAEELDAFETGELIAFDREHGEPAFEETFRKDKSDGVHGHGFMAVQEWRRLLEDARREGIVP